MLMPTSDESKYLIRPTQIILNGRRENLSADIYELLDKDNPSLPSSSVLHIRYIGGFNLHDRFGEPFTQKQVEKAFAKLVETYEKTGKRISLSDDEILRN